MTRQHKLTSRQVSAETRVGRHSDGGCLYLNVASGGTKSWVFLYSFRGHQREAGLGSVADVSLAEARDKAATQRKLLKARVDPLEEKKAAIEADKADKAAKKARRSFGQCADELIATNRKSWSASHTSQWIDLKRHAAGIWSMPVDSIEVRDVLEVMKSLSATPETVYRVRGRVEAVLDFAKAHGLRQGENPAAWKGNLAHLLPKRQKSKDHHAALPYTNLPGFIAELRSAESVARRALEFCILTTTRSGETRFARWSEFDLDAKVWSIPAERMKAAQPYCVPLSNRVLIILEELAAHRINDFVFAGRLRKQPVGENAMRDLLPPGATVHGFRSSFRDWCGDQPSVAREIAEQCLAHSVGNAVERAYRRGDALEKRRTLMESWANYIEPSQAGNVVPLRA